MTAPDISTRDFWSQPFAVRDETFAQLRAAEGPTWHLFHELLTRVRRIEFGEPDYLFSNFVHGVKRVPTFVR